MVDLSRPYNLENFKIFLTNFLPYDFKINVINFDTSLYKKIFKEIKLIGKVPSLNNLPIFEIKRITPEKSRVKITKELFRFVKNHGFDNALAVIFSDKEEHFRFSFITSTLSWSSETKVVKEFSNPKRLSFLLGGSVSVHTAKKKLIESGKVKNFNDLYSRFNIEIVNDEFFYHYKNLYLDLKSKLDDDKEFKSFAKKIDLNIDFFAKKLLGQIVFCYFLQKKGWLGVDENKSFGTGDKSFLRNKFNEFEKKNENFFNNFLEYFFYKGLNQINTNDFVKEINCRVPYVGGNLFEYYEEYNWEKESLKISNSTFSNSKGNGILDIFDLYNFTIDEQDDTDIEMSIDPEMLGRIFENLLDENIRKRGGSFYTPKSIVNYMCEKSLEDYLNKKLKGKINSNEISDFISSKKINFSEKNNIKENAKFLDHALESIKICDPAIGSGAFAVGMVNLISKLRLSLINYIDRRYKNSSYYFKRDCILNSIYGVDIDITAVEISKLRLWLCLIVDEIDYNSTEPLPNLDYNIMQGNSLIDEFYGYEFNINNNNNKQLTLYESLNEIEDLVKELSILQKKYSNLKQFLKRKELKLKINNTLLKIFKKTISDHKKFDKNHTKKIQNNFEIEKINLKKKNFFCWQLFFADIFFLNNGFDLIIANPPYEALDSKEYKDEILKLKKFSIYEHAIEGQINYYKLFVVKSLSLLNEGGTSVFIYQNSFLGDKSCTKLRKFIFDNFKLFSLISFPERDDPNKRIFKSAKMSVCISQISKSKNNILDTFDLQVWNDKEKKNGFKIEFEEKFVKQDLYYRIPSVDKMGLDIYRKVLKNPKVVQLQKIGKVFSGEVDMTFHKKFFSEKKTLKNNFQIFKGANIQRYFVTNKVSQGKNEFLDKDAFLKESNSARSNSFKNERIAMQGITGVNEKFRLKSCLVNKNIFLANSTNFIINNSLEFSNYEIIIYLNSKFLNWYFKIFSTNSNVNTYEVNVLPLIKFTNNEKKIIQKIFNENSFINEEETINNIIYSSFELNENEKNYIDSQF